jgi:asparagine synthase (glutamine-hydrolysing)
VGMYCLLPLLPIGLQQHVLQALTRRKFARARGTFLPEWMPEALQADLEQRHLELTLAAERGRRFANPSREREYRLLYPPEVGRPASGRPLQVWRPFADRRLHEFLLAIPPEQKFEPHPASDEWYAGSKLVVRRAMRGILPEAVRTRTVKTHFASLFEHEFQRRWPDFEGAFGPSGDSELAARGYIEPGLFWERLQQLREGDRGGDFMYLLRLMGVETWLRTLRQPRVQLVRVPDRSVGDPFTPSTSIERERQPVAG